MPRSPASRARRNRRRQLQLLRHHVDLDIEVARIGLCRFERVHSNREDRAAGSYRRANDHSSLGSGEWRGLAQRLIAVMPMDVGDNDFIGRSDIALNHHRRPIQRLREFHDQPACAGRRCQNSQISRASNVAQPVASEQGYSVSARTRLDVSAPASRANGTTKFRFRRRSSMLIGRCLETAFATMHHLGSSVVIQSRPSAACPWLPSFPDGQPSVSRLKHGNFSLPLAPVLIGTRSCALEAPQPRCGEDPYRHQHRPARRPR